MNRPSVRIALALVAVAVVALCGYRLAVLERQLDDAAHAAAAVNEHAEAALIERYQEGIELLKACHRSLETYRRRVEELSRDAEEAMKPFEKDPDFGPDGAARG